MSGLAALMEHTGLVNEGFDSSSMLEYLSNEYIH